MKRIIFVLILLMPFCGTFAQNGLTKLYRVVLTERIKDIDRDTIFNAVQLVQVDFKQSSTWVRVFEYNTKRAYKTDGNKFLKVIGIPIDHVIPFELTDQTILSDSIKNRIAKHYGVARSKVLKVSN